jgi:DNA repair exonuclease SbcCD ATPase subunit
MSKDINVSISVKPRRALNDVDFAAAIQSLSVGDFQALNNRDSVRNYTFGGNGYAIAVNGRHIQVFLSDVRAILEENVQYERTEAELRKANQQWADEHLRMSADIRRLSDELTLARERDVEQEGKLAELTERLDRNLEANLTWEQRHTNVTEKLAARNLQVDNLVAQLTAKDALLNAAGRDLEVLRERNAELERLNANQSESIKQYQAGKDPVADYLIKQYQEQIHALTDRCDSIAAARNKQADTIIGFQQRMAAFDAEATRLREEVAAERAARRQEAANAAREIALLREANESFATSHTANYERESSNARTYLEEIVSLRNTIAVIGADNDRLTNKLVRLTDQRDAALGRLGSDKAERKPTRVVLVIHADGSVQLDTGDAPVVVQGNVSVNGEVAA